MRPISDYSVHQPEAIKGAQGLSRLLQRFAIYFQSLSQ